PNRQTSTSTPTSRSKNKRWPAPRPLRRHVTATSPPTSSSPSSTGCSYAGSPISTTSHTKAKPTLERTTRHYGPPGIVHRVLAHRRFRRVRVHGPFLAALRDKPSLARLGRRLGRLRPRSPRARKF